MAEPTAAVDECAETVLTIGEAAEQLGMTPRTLRYYEELGLVTSSRRSTTAQRRYGPEEIRRLQRIRELQTLLGLGLDEIGEPLAAFDRLEGIRAEFQSTPAPERRQQMLAEGLAILERLRSRVTDRQEHLEQFAGELDARIERYRGAIAEATSGKGRGRAGR